MTEIHTQFRSGNRLMKELYAPENDPHETKNPAKNPPPVEDEDPVFLSSSEFG